MWEEDPEGEKNLEVCNTLEKLSSSFFFFFKKPGLALSAATELRQYKLSGGPVLREVVLKEEIREKYTIRSVYFQAPSD